MQSFNYKTDLKHLYGPSSKSVELLDVPAMKFLMVDGVGDPNGPEFQDAVGALYGVAYTIKMLPKKGRTPEGYVIYQVPPLEALWWVRGTDSFAWNAPTADFCWTVIMMQPDFVTGELVAAAAAEQQAKKQLVSFSKLRLECFAEGLSMQIMHIGPYSEEPRSLQRLEEFASERGLFRNGHHHEIYLGDPRRSAPEKLRTILRYAVRKNDQ